MTPLRIMHVASECAPFAKTGGLADVVAGLSAAQADCGHEVRVVLPDYPILRGATKVPGPRYTEAFANETVGYSWRNNSERPAGPTVHFVTCDQLFKGAIYGAGEREAYRFILLCRAALQLCTELGWYPDILHCHDWHAGLLPALLKHVQRSGNAFQAARSVLTIHNIGYQGTFPRDVVDAASLHAVEDLLPDGDHLNLLRAGILNADVVSTVSPTYAEEIKTPAFGMGLEADLGRDDIRLVGILNGADYTQWDPSQDAHLPANFSAANLSGKRKCKMALMNEVGLGLNPTAPLVGLVSRLVDHKGIDLVIEALPLLMNDREFGCVVLGDGETRYVAALDELAELNERIAFIHGYDDALAHRIIAGCDILVVPSRYEPCGLTQIYAMRYGTVPVVRHTGGLADTVQHFYPETGLGNGVVFRDADVGGVSWGIGAAMDWFDRSELWSAVVENAMAMDFSWAKQWPKYEKLFRDLVAAPSSSIRTSLDSPR